MLCFVLHMAYILASIMLLLLLSFKLCYKLYIMVAVCCFVQVLHSIQNRPLQQPVWCNLNYLGFGVWPWTRFWDALPWPHPSNLEGLLSKMC